ncbi:PA0069 family radical SAM protein [Pseudaestuariivita atlantica]|uniref:DNA repair photolyase n=1 Tax=Pseudaestuariivita atlantica TaxID=1317121 RepID=A0A0L1JM12_9RHOB|nr:PA0069 family radical SAM protein [Pseudaestuariivita atlantica]KNG92796.1 DNA repair photolyase [Pseudaestuariivita atlantica]
MTQPPDAIDPARRRARGAVSNAPGRFDLAREAVDDGWDREEDLPPFRTEVSVEHPRRVITRNTSPDLSFDRAINPYRGCEHGCVYCFARPTHAYLGLSAGLDFETRLVAKDGAAEVLEAELRKPSYRADVLALGTATDPYQPEERDRRLTREVLKVLARARHPVAIVTKGTLIERDIDLLGPMAAEGLVRVGMSITTLDARLARAMEPRCPTPARRLAAVQRLSEAGVPVRVMTSPIVPGLTDHEVEALLAAAAKAGAVGASWVMLRLPREVSPLFREWLEEHVPDRAARVMARVREMHGGQDYDARWGHRLRGEGHYAQMIAARWRRAARANGLDIRLPPLRTDLFRRPERAGDQLSLFDVG